MANGQAHPVLVTGALGAIGSWVVRRLVEQGEPVVAVDWRADFSLIPDLERDVLFVEGDILNRDWLSGLVKDHGVRRILHLAALMPPACEEDPLRGYQVNFTGALNIFEVARDQRLERVVFMSSKARYGAVTGRHTAPEFEPLTEDYQNVPLDVYGSTKLALEEAARHFRRLYDLDLITLRLGSTYGPGKLARHGAVGLACRIVEMAFAGQPFVVPTPGQRDDMVYNRDVAKAIVLAGFAPRTEHWQFNISGGQLVTIREFAEEAMRLCPRHQLTIDNASPNPAKPSTASLMSIARARAELGYEPDFPGVSGVAHYVEHLRQHEAARMR
jgi:UDP-glucose 4-epimerase